MGTALEGLRTVIYPVADVAAAKEWWTNFLGHGPYFDEVFYVGFEVAGYELGLVPAVGATLGATTGFAWARAVASGRPQASREKGKAHIHALARALRSRCGSRSMSLIPG